MQGNKKKKYSPWEQELWEKAWSHIENSDTGDLTGFGSHVNPDTGETVRFRVNKLNKKNKTGIKLVKTKNIAESALSRTKAGILQTVGDSTFPSGIKDVLEVHHKRMLQLYAPLYKGLNDAEALELSKYFVEIGMPLGNKLENADILPVKPHKEIHRFIDDITNKLKEFPDFGKTLEDRKFHAKNFYKNFIQSSIDEETIKIMQNYRAKNLYDYMKYYGSELGSITKNGSNGANGANGLNGIKAKLLNTSKMLNSTARKTANFIEPVAKPVLQFAKPAVKYGVPVAGTVLAASNQRTLAAEYDKSPTTISRARKKIADLQVGLEAVDTATLGATGAVTWVPNLIGDVAEYGLWRTQNPQTKEEFNKELENNGGFNGTI